MFIILDISDSLRENIEKIKYIQFLPRKTFMDLKIKTNICVHMCAQTVIRYNWGAEPVLGS